MRSRRYVPDAGDIVWLNFDPKVGREQAGHRPALVLSPARYNKASDLMICCPMTSRIKNYPFEVVISGSTPSAVLSDQIKSVDWRNRGARFKGVITATELADVRAKIRALIGLSAP